MSSTYYWVFVLPKKHIYISCKPCVKMFNRHTGHLHTL